MASVLLRTILGQPLPDDAIRRKVAEVLSRPEYQLESLIDPDAVGVWLRVLMWLLQPLIWLFEALDGLPESLRWLLVIVLALVLLLLVAHMAWMFVSAVRGTPRRSAVLAHDRAAKLTPADFEQAAADAEGLGDYITASRVLFLASLLRIEQAEKKTLRRGVTNRELLRRYRSSPLFEPLGSLVDTIERKWYGHEACLVSDYERCRAAYGRIIALLQRRPETNATTTSSAGAKSNAIGA